MSLVCGGMLQTCSQLPDREQQIRLRGELRVATVNGPTTYYLGTSGPTGFEYELAQVFADRLGVPLTPVVVANAPLAVEEVRRGRADFAAAGLSTGSHYGEGLRYSQPLMSVVPQLVCRADALPTSLDAFEGRLLVVANGAEAGHLRALRQRHPLLSWEESDQLDAESLLGQVAEGEIDCTVVNSDLVAINLRYYPQLRVGPAVADAQALAWAFSALGDESLYGAAQDFLRRYDTAALARLRDRYFGHVEQVDYLGAVALAGHYSSRLPRFREAFIEAGKAFGLDWRLLAAISYQESQWDPQATSPTGVQGLMQLTMATASFMDVADRNDPGQSIWGGARYFRWLLDQLPDSIDEPDRSWLGLAAYNMGLGHLQDAQLLADKRGGDARHWLDVRNALPLLTQTRWNRETRYGYARGYQAVHYVNNVRTYYNMLVWMSESEAGADPEPLDPTTAELPLIEPQPKSSPDLIPNLSSPVI